MGRRRWRGASTPTPFLLLHPLQPHTHSASIGLSQKTCTYRRKKRALDRVFCVGRAVAKNAHLPSQKTRSGSCFLRRSVLPSQKTLINVQIYAPSGITWVTVAKNAPPNGFRPLICLMVEGYLLFWGGGGFSTKMVKTKKVIYFGGI